MSRTLELGRAVLSTAHSHQLWFTTLITISPQHEATNLLHIKQNDLIDQLLTGIFWVRRGNGLHLVLEVTVEGEPLERDEQDKLTQSLINAPAWSQLNLRPSLPAGKVGEVILPGRRIQIGIHHARKDDNLQAKQSHRLGFNVPCEDITPPEGVPILALQSVSVSMNLINVKPRLKSKQQKRSTQRLQLNPTKAAENGREDPLKDVSSEIETESVLSEDIEQLKTLQQPATAFSKNAPQASSQSQCGDMQENPPILHRSNAALETLVPNTSVHCKKRKRAASTTVDTVEVEKLVDAAMRVSICKSTPKLAQGTKLVTKAFIATLSEVCPAVWSPEYLPTLSQRAHFLPTMSRAVGRVATRQLRSLPFQAKVRQLASYSTESSLNSANSKDLWGHPEHDRIAQSLQTRLWLYTHKKLPDKSTSPLDAFWSPATQCPQVKNMKDGQFDAAATLHEPGSYNSYARSDDVHLDATPSDSSRLDTCKISPGLSGISVSDRILLQTEFKPSHRKLDHDDLLLGSTQRNLIDDGLNEHGQTDSVAGSLIREEKATIHAELEDAWLERVTCQNADSFGAGSLGTFRCLQDTFQIPQFGHDDPVLLPPGTRNRNSDDPDEILLWASTDTENTTAF